MLRAFLSASLAVLVAGSIYAQAANEFDVATIKPAAPSNDGRSHTRFSTDTGTGNLFYLNVNLKESIGKAYKVQTYQISGPDWLETARFDIVAKFPPGTSSGQILLMLQDLLADRFKLTLHRETKELPVYTLTLAKGGSKMKPAETSSGITSNFSRTTRHIAAAVSMESLADFLMSEAGRPVLNKTGLTDPYRISLDWAADTAPAGNDGSALPSLFTALQEQLGLKLAPARSPVEVLVVDRIERTPTEN
ncbi:MAG TPA: TIGR03435 family protein [Bryobacteraceae bacterium]|jgi:uncharacterized protein (TIGR03435 family)|nr:TIGR03435 family protein [Bryobacteraceae bacterium]